MTGLLYIGTLDAFTTYGVVPLSYLGPATWPALKTPDVIEWPEEDGIRPDLTAPKLASRDFDLQLASISDSANISALTAALTATGYHTFNFAEIGRTLNLRMVGQPQYTHFGTARVFSIRVADDTPLNGYVYTEPDGDVPDQEYQLDGVNFNFYSARVLNGTSDSVERVSDTKPGLLIDEPNIAGAIWDAAQTVYFKSKPIALKCLIVSPTPAAFWINYNNLLYDLSKAGERILTSTIDQSAFYCYYQDGRVDRFEKTAIGGIWCEFTINLIATRPSLPQ